MHRQAMRELRSERWHTLLRRLAWTSDRFAAAALGSRRPSSAGIAALVSSSVFRGAHLLDSSTQGDNSCKLPGDTLQPGIQIFMGMQESASPQAASDGRDTLGGSPIGLRVDGLCTNLYLQ